MNFDNEEGMLLGQFIYTKKPLYVSHDDLIRNVLIVGQSGVGKTVFGQLLMFQQIAKGGGLVFINGKNGEMQQDESFGELNDMAAYHGRQNDVLVINLGNPDESKIDLLESIQANKIIYVMLPPTGKSQTASNQGKMFLGDAKTAFSLLQTLPEEEKPNPPFLFFMDDAGSYATESMARLFEQNRSAKVFICATYQSIDDMKKVDPEVLQTVMGNTWIKVFFKVAHNETADFVTDSIGQDIETLEIGKAVITVGGDRVYRVEITDIDLFAKILNKEE